MSQKTHAVITRTIGIDTGKNTLHLVGLDDRGTIVLRESLAAAGLGPGLRIFRGARLVSRPAWRRTMWRAS